MWVAARTDGTEVRNDKIVVMGVSGAGKSTLGAALAKALGWRFLDADDFHSAEAKAHIAAGRALDEAERDRWLARILPVFQGVDQPAVLACSALKQHHRTTLLPHRLVYIAIDPELALARLAGRTGHFAGPSLAPSQFAALEVPETAIVVQADQSTQDQLAHVLAAVSLA
jgi:gluconokinase